MHDATPPVGFGRPDHLRPARGPRPSGSRQRLEPDGAVLACRVVDPDQWCRRCGTEGPAPDSVNRRLAHEPLGWRPSTLEVVVRRYQRREGGHVRRQDTTAAAEPPREAFARRNAVGTARHRRATPGHHAGRRGTRRHMEHQQRRPGRGEARLDQRPEEARRREGQSGSMSTSGGTPAAVTSTSSRAAPSKRSRPGWVSGRSRGATGVEVVVVMDPFHVLPPGRVPPGPLPATGPARHSRPPWVEGTTRFTSLAAPTSRPTDSERCSPTGPMARLKRPGASTSG